MKIAKFLILFTTLMATILAIRKRTDPAPKGEKVIKCEEKDPRKYDNQGLNCAHFDPSPLVVCDTLYNPPLCRGNIGHECYGAGTNRVVECRHGLECDLSNPNKQGAGKCIEVVTKTSTKKK